MSSIAHALTYGAPNTADYFNPHIQLLLLYQRHKQARGTSRQAGKHHKQKRYRGQRVRAERKETMGKRVETIPCCPAGRELSQGRRRPSLLEKGRLAVEGGIWPAGSGGGGAGRLRGESSSLSQSWTGNFLHNSSTASCLNHKDVQSNVVLDEDRPRQGKGRKSQATWSIMASGKKRGAISTATTSGSDQNKNGSRGKLKKVVLAYSGGLDTSVIVPWLRANYGCEVVCFTADVGQGASELEGLEEKAKASGASQLIVKDLKEEFVTEYIYPCLRAGAVFERKYLLGTAMARPAIAKAMVDVAKEVGADAVAHGCTGKSNDQVRFELAFYALNLGLKVVAPWREWEITGREEAIEYAKKHNVPVPVSKKSTYSRDRNLWHLSHEGDVLEDPANEPNEDLYMISVVPENAPSKPEYLEIGIVTGVPVSINGRGLSPASLLAELNEIGGKHGIGRVDMVENRLIGVKSRGVYETPGGTIMSAALRELEALTLDMETMQWKDMLALKYAELVYAGRWFDPLRESMDAFMETITSTITGSVSLKLFKGSVNVVSRTSPYSLYREDICSFENGDVYNPADAEGFIKLYGLPARVRAMLESGT